MIEVTLIFASGAWRKPQRWTAVITPQMATRGRSFEMSNEDLETLRKELTAHLTASLGEPLKPEFFSWSYVANGVDYTADLAKLADLRQQMEKAKITHTAARLKLALTMRDKGLSVRSIGEMMGYMQSSVAMFIRKRNPND
jgi:hypothetical protein